LYQPTACERLVEALRKCEGWENAQVREGSTAEDYRNTDRSEIRTASVLRSADALTFLAQFDEKLDSVIKPLIKETSGVDLSESFGTQLIRYSRGGHYVAHADAGRDLDSRYFTVVCYINDDFEGGSTSFPSLNYRVRPQCGKAVVFPARYIHCAEPVIRGEKYVFVSWIHGPTTIKWI
jgi:predicted 2-oxoglutarate/Fe(II)-dependent dioxygenase YbiX